MLNYKKKPMVFSILAIVVVIIISVLLMFNPPNENVITASYSNGSWDMDLV